MKDGHFGRNLICFIQYQYLHACVTQPLILEQLHEFGIDISSGRIHRILVENKERSYLEKEEILKTGLEISKHVHVDDTGARHKRKTAFALTYRLPDNKFGCVIARRSTTYTTSSLCLPKLII